MKLLGASARVLNLNRPLMGSISWYDPRHPHTHKQMPDWGSKLPLLWRSCRWTARWWNWRSPGPASGFGCFGFQKWALEFIYISISWGFNELRAQSAWCSDRNSDWWSRLVLLKGLGNKCRHHTLLPANIMESLVLEIILRKQGGVEVLSKKCIWESTQCWSLRTLKILGLSSFS